MATPYVPPGVTITEATTPQVVPLLTSTSETVLVGLSSGHSERTDQLVLEGTSPQKLPFLESSPGSKLVKINSVYSVAEPTAGESEGKGFTITTDYTENTTTGTISRVGAGHVTNKTLCNITYEYRSADYFNPVRLFNFNEVQARFGPALEGETVSSVLSLAAQKAFENGAQSLILQPLFRTSTGKIVYNTKGYIENGEQPNTTQSAEKTTWETTLQALNTVEVIDLLVPVLGTAMEHVTDGVVGEVIKVALGYELTRSTEEQYVVGVFGADASNGTEGKDSEIRNYAASVRSYAGGALAQQNIIVNTANFSIPLSQSAGTLNVGGQYMAAAVAGALASRPSASSLTRKGINGFSAVKDLRTPVEKNKDAEEGLMVIEQVKGEFIRCRHAVTTDTSHGAARSEVSVVRAKFNMIESIRETLENQVVGQIIADANSPIIVRSAISGVLSALVAGGQLISYETPVVALASLEPTTITASFSYRPAFTLNYIHVTFSLDLSSQTVSIVEKAKS